MKYAMMKLCPCLLLFLAPADLYAQAFLQYQYRGDRYEGVQSQPIAGEKIELISAMADLEMPQVWPDLLHIRFYLEETEPVYLTVREVDNVKFYWLDQVDQNRWKWKAGFGNVFSWPTRDVLAHFEGLEMSDLGVVARLGDPHGGLEERVAPVTFYQGEPPATIDRYLFVFKTEASMQIAIRLYRPDAAEAEELGSSFCMAGHPFTVPLDLSAAPDGDYRLVLAGGGIFKTVTFHHRDLAYKDRGGRREGLRDLASAGDLLELIAAMADLPMPEKWPAQLHVRFYLAEVEPVYLAVRVLDDKGSYWLDGVDPDRWGVGFDNVFSWPTGDVLAHLEGLKMSDLGVIARLGTLRPDLEERVAPVIFYHGEPPARIGRYLFVFKPEISTRIASRLLQPGAAEPEELGSRVSRKGRPFTVSLDLSGAPEGDYRLELEGGGISKRVEFHHHGQVR